MTAAPNAPRRRLLFGAALALAASITRSGAAADAAAGGKRPLEIGILPYMPTATLLAGHQPLRRHFEETFGRPVALSTAPDFHSFQRRVLAGDFDFFIIGPGPGWQAHVDRRHEIVAVSKRLVSIYFLVPKDSSVRRIADLRGRSLATIDPLTVTAQTAMTLLREHRLQPGIDVHVRHDKTPFNAAQAAALGEVDAAAFPNVSYPNLPEEIRARLRIMYESDAMPGVLFMARAAPDMPTPEEFRAALFAFAATPAGQAYLKEFNHDALLAPDLKALRVLERFLPETRRLMGQP